MEQILDLELKPHLIPDLITIVKAYAKEVLVLTIRIENGKFFHLQYGNPSGIEIDWGDGTPLDTSSGSLLIVGTSYKHQYFFETTKESNFREFELKISGNADILKFHSGYLIKVDSYGGFTPSRITFQACTELVKVPDYLPKSVTSTYSMFTDCHKFNQVLNFDTSRVVDMSSMFYNCYQFNQPVNFDTSHVKSFSSMFYGCFRFNQPLDFNTSQADDFENMFDRCPALRQKYQWVIKPGARLARMFNSSKGGSLVKISGLALPTVEPVKISSSLPVAVESKSSLVSDKCQAMIKKTQSQCSRDKKQGHDFCWQHC